MNETTPRSARRRAVWLNADACSLDEFRALVEAGVGRHEVPRAVEIRSNIPVYDAGEAARLARDPKERRDLLAEWAALLMDGPGILVLKQAVADVSVVDRATAAFNAMIRRQHEAGAAAGDHFAKPGANDRIWNALEKLCLQDPELFAEYYASEVIALVSEAWLGPCYQVTSQINVVNPGGEAQAPHRDYHLGFQTDAEAERYPAHVHCLSPALTLQGAVAHSDMPVESGPTKLLPFSQRYEAGYLAWRRPEFKDYFEAHFVQLALAKGDAVFFNPAVFHAAGTNRTKHVIRMANLLQISSAYGRAMESVDRQAMCAALYPALLALKERGRLDGRGIDNAIAAAAEGYAFPTNLDRDPPLGGLAPPSQAALMREALDEGWTAGVFLSALEDHARRRLTR